MWLSISSMYICGRVCRTCTSSHRQTNILIDYRLWKQFTLLSPCFFLFCLYLSLCFCVSFVYFSDCFNMVSRYFTDCFNMVSRCFTDCFNMVSRYFTDCFNMVSRYFLTSTVRAVPVSVHDHCTCTQPICKLHTQLPHPHIITYPLALLHPSISTCTSSSAHLSRPC